MTGPETPQDGAESTDDAPAAFAGPVSHANPGSFSVPMNRAGEVVEGIGPDGSRVVL